MTQVRCEVKSCAINGLARFEGVNPCDDDLPFAHEPIRPGHWRHVGTCEGCMGDGRFVDLSTPVDIRGASPTDRPLWTDR